MRNPLDDADIDSLAKLIENLAHFDAIDEAENNPTRTVELYLRSFFAPPPLPESRKHKGV